MAVGDYIYLRADTGSGFSYKKISLADGSLALDSGKTAFEGFMFGDGIFLTYDNGVGNHVAYDSSFTQQWDAGRRYEAWITSYEGIDAYYTSPYGNSYVGKYDRGTGTEAWLVGISATSPPVILAGSNGDVGAVDGSEFKVYNKADGTQDTARSITLSSSYTVDGRQITSNSSDVVFFSPNSSSNVVKLDVPAGTETTPYSGSYNVIGLRALADDTLIAVESDGTNTRVVKLGTDGTLNKEVLGTGSNFNPSTDGVGEALPEGEFVWFDRTNSVISVINHQNNTLDRQFTLTDSASNTSFAAMPRPNQFPSAWQFAEQISASPVAAAAVMNTPSVLEVLAATQITSPATMNTTDVLELLGATKISVTSTMNPASAFAFEALTASQIQVSGTPNDATISLFINAEQPASSATMLNPLLAIEVAASQINVNATVNNGNLFTARRSPIGVENIATIDMSKTGTVIKESKNDAE